MLDESDINCMKAAVAQARQCSPEDDRVHPFVGAVLAVNGSIQAETHRGDRSQPGAHAEYLLLEHILKEEPVAGATVYTTLEPCTTRNHPKQPCAERLIARKIARVVIGMLDPNQAITGKGILRLREANVRVDLFPPDLMGEIEDLNRHFSAAQRTPGHLSLSAWRGYETLNVLVPHDTRRAVLIGQNLSSRLGLSEQEQNTFVGQLRAVLERGTHVTLVIMPPDVLKAVHLEAAQDLARFTLPALERISATLASYRNQVQILFHPAATLSLLAVDGRYAYVTPKFQKTAQISDRLTLKLGTDLFDSASLERMIYEALKGQQGARALSLEQGVIALRSELVGCGLLDAKHSV